MKLDDSDNTSEQAKSPPTPTSNDSNINKATEREYWQATEAQMKLVVDDDKAKEMTSIIVNRSYNHYVQYFARQPELLKSYMKSSSTPTSTDTKIEKELVVDLQYDNRRHWFKVHFFKTEAELRKALRKAGIKEFPFDTIAYTDNFVDGEECGRMYIWDTSIDTLSHEATHMALGILARHGHTSLVVTTEEEPELSHDLCKLVGAITEEIATQILTSEKNKAV